MILYLDTSALVKRYVRESGSREVVLLFDQAEIAGSSVMTKIEIASAFSKAVRRNWLTAEEVEIVWQDFLEDWPSYARLAVTPSLIDRASTNAKTYSLRAYDALHLTTVLNWQDTLEKPITLATYDRELWQAAKIAGVSVWPATIQ